jgi:hypothetical protein
LPTDAHGAKRQYPLVDRQKIDHIARLATPVGRGYFVGGKVNRVQNVAEHLVADRRKKAAVHNPFQLRGLTPRAAKTVYMSGLRRSHRGV